MILSIDKTKILIFNKSRRIKKENWRWKNNKIEEVDSFRYLGFTFNKEANYKENLKELKKKAITAVRAVWGLGEIKCKGNFKRRLMLFDYLVRSVMSYGVEIWGWEERKELEKVEADYLRWILRLDFCTSRYIVYKETDRNKLCTKWGARAIKFENRISKMDEHRMIKYWTEKSEVVEKERDLYNKERIDFLKSLGLRQVAIEVARVDGNEYIKNIIVRSKDIEKQNRELKIRESKYNKRYKFIATETRPKYLCDNTFNNQIEFVARIR